MKKLYLLVLTFVCASPLLAQWRPGGAEAERPVTSEEVRLLEAFRANPEPFRQVLAGQFPRSTAVDQGIGVGVAGPRDFIDVTVSEGKIAFYGKRKEYLPTSVRVSRGETAFMIFSREDSSIETKVVVSYLADGLHFDVKEPYGETHATPRGFIVIPESRAWRSGEMIPWTGRLDDARSVSKAENITFRIRYVSR